MKLDFLTKEISLTGNKKDTYPSKKTINLYYKEDKTTRPSTIALYVIFFVVVAAFAAKLLVFDLASELANAEKQVAAKQEHLDEQLELLQDYSDISSQYSRYSSSYLRPEEKLVDRMEVLAMLEKTVFANSNTKSVTITEDLISINFVGPNLEQTASIVKMVEEYDIVSFVEVSTASLDDTYSTNMMITLVGMVEEDTTGGEQ